MKQKHSSSLPWSEALRERFGFDTPKAFQSLEARGLFRWSSEFRDMDLSKPGDDYLCFNDMEWYPPDELRIFRFESYHKAGFVPFAHAGNGDYWCWYPTLTKDEKIPVLLCPHDCYDADLYAPDFAGSLYRHALEYATYDEEDRGRMLKRFAVDLREIWPSAWREHINQLADEPFSWSKYEKTIAAEFGRDWVGHFQVRWMNE